MPHGTSDPNVPNGRRPWARRVRPTGSDRLRPHGSAPLSRAVMPVESFIESWSPPAADEHLIGQSLSGPGELIGPIGPARSGDQFDGVGRPEQPHGQPPQYHWQQDVHHHHYCAYAPHTSTQPPQPGAASLPSLASLPRLAQPRLSRAGSCLAVFLVLLGAFVTFMVMLMGLALAGQILMLR